MPKLPQHDEDPGMVEIPPRLYRALQANGYTGSNIVHKDALQRILDKYGDSNQGPPGNPDVPYVPGDGGGSSGSAGPSPQQLANLKASYLSILHSWGIDVNANMQKLMNQGLDQQWSTTNFVNHLRTTMEYKTAFAGIQRGMTESSYIGMFRWYKDRAKDIGWRLTTQEFGGLLKKGVDQAEWNARVQAGKQIMDNRQLFNTFEQVLKYRGELKPSEHLTMKNLERFIRGQGSPMWEKIWEEAAVTTQLTHIGFDVTKMGHKGDIGRKELLRLIDNWESRNPGQEFEAQGDAFYQKLSDQINALPASQMQAFGLKRGDILEMALGGPRREQVAQQVQAVLAKVKGMEQPGAIAESGLTQEGFRLIEGAPERAQVQ